MKKIIILIILFFVYNFSINAQKIHETNAIYLVLQPTDQGVGIRYDRKIKPIYGVYGALTFGAYENEFKQISEHHYKFVSGVLLYANNRNKNFNPYFGIGCSYNIYEGLYDNSPNLPETELNKISFEFSVNAKIQNKLNMGIRVDPKQKECSLDAGLSF